MLNYYRNKFRNINDRYYLYFRENEKSVSKKIKLIELKITSPIIEVRIKKNLVMQI